MMRNLLRRSLAAWVLLMTVAVAPTALGAKPCDSPATTILIVRHADRAGKADSLSEAGMTRARDLSRVALTANVAAIYHSDTRRTRDTVAPLAAALQIQPEEYPAKEGQALIERILRDHPGKTVIVVGHSNTVPVLVAAAGGPMIQELNEDEFDGLFIVNVSPCRDRPSTLTQLQYGAPSP
jgi:broad specificity phosphatase PhoE